ncbi:Piso0_003523 [Millerozyma farinosa CBS 7064]|uniref:nicotinamidase n=1 Tax=Pichia sorbitophila (strain ATCC MYA-4447 / BCRC 22081 / CBS 7064 / NBRC 10061 / NRRL Y-12695) TaxID=559304 RepID=G8YJB2_PICSO|nr:Piso0_003523 [Millerozyma farinosa CBS 7064]CCE81172.1 Piso0_003523 [Millerozyma farinosa CBS 7064]
MSRKAALVVIDLQYDFLPPDGSLAVANGNDVVLPIINLIKNKNQWNLLIATQDWHPKDHISFASQHNTSPYTELSFTHPLKEKDDGDELLTKKQTVWPDHCVQGTHGAELNEQFKKEWDNITEPEKYVVKKGYLQDREYYSCFMDVWGLHKTEMTSVLHEHGITDVVFVGLAYDFCVLNSAIDASRLGFNSYVIKECCRSVYADKVADTDNKYSHAGVKVISINDLSAA